MATRATIESNLEDILDIHNDTVSQTMATLDPASQAVGREKTRLTGHRPPDYATLFKNDGPVLEWGSLSAHRSCPSSRRITEGAVCLPPNTYRRTVGAKLPRDLVGLAARNGSHTLVGLIAKEHPNSDGPAAAIGLLRVGTSAEFDCRYDRWLNITVHRHKPGS